MGWGWVINLRHSAPTGLKQRARFYPGLPPGATNVPPRWGSFLWLCIRIYWIGKIIRIDFCVCAGYWVHDIGPPAGLKRRSRLYPGLTPGATNVAPRWGSFLWLRIRIYLMGSIIRIDFCVLGRKWGSGVWCG